MCTRVLARAGAYMCMFVCVHVCLSVDGEHSPDSVVRQPLGGAGAREHAVEVTAAPSSSDKAEK